MSKRPSWQISPCPPWCVREHEESDIGGDRDHQSEPICVPIIRVVRHISSVSVREFVANYFAIAAFQAPNEYRPSVAIALSEDSHVCLELRDESAERLCEALRLILIGFNS